MESNIRQIKIKQIEFLSLIKLILFLLNETHVSQTRESRLKCEESFFSEYKSTLDTRENWFRRFVKFISC